MYSKTLHLLIWSCLLVQLSWAEVQKVKVDTKFGSITGFKHTTRDNEEVEIFLNIPYAQPPVGELRFEKPLPIDNWGDKDGTKFGFDCVPHHVNGSIFPISEDCLTLNIMRPTTPPPAEGFPILFKIHGGGYEIGAASIYGYKGFSDLYVQHGIIVVTIQYRIGFLGFLSTGDNELPGNLGLWDQTLALKFVYDNIEIFGGNKDKITVFGYSAGSAAAGQLTLSPESRDYIYASVQMSGSPFASWAVGHRVPEASFELMEKLGCKEEFKSCMKKKSISEMQQAVLDVGYTRDDLSIIKWGPVIDGDFFPAPPAELVRQGRPIPTFLGISNKDAGFFGALGLSQLIHRFYPQVEGIKNFNAELFESYTKKFFVKRDFGPNTDKVLKEIKQYFIERGYNNEGRGFYISRYVDLINDLTFATAAVSEVLTKNEAGWPSYLYSFEHYNPLIYKNHDIPEYARGSVHVAEYPYVFGIFVLAQFEMVGVDRKIQDDITGYIRSMVFTGKPADDYKLAGDELNYKTISENPEFKKDFYRDNFNFWRHINITYGYDAITLPLPPITHPIVHEEL